jgi:hypothetical protein
VQWAGQALYVAIKRIYGKDADFLESAKVI